MRVHINIHTTHTHSSPLHAHTDLQQEQERKRQAELDNVARIDVAEFDDANVHFQLTRIFKDVYENPTIFTPQV